MCESMWQSHLHKPRGQQLANLSRVEFGKAFLSSNIHYPAKSVSCDHFIVILLSSNMKYYYLPHPPLPSLYLHSILCDHV